MANPYSGRGNATNGRLALAALFLFAASTIDAAACGRTTGLDQAQQHHLHVLDGESLAVRLIHVDTEYAFCLSDGQSKTALSSPVGRYGSQYLLLSAGDWNLSVSPMYRGSTLNDYRLETRVLPDSSPDAAPFNQAVFSLHKAAELWAADQEGSREQALTLFEAVADTKLQDWDLSFEAEVALARGLLTRLKPAAAEARLRQLAMASSPRPYEVSWLMATALVEQLRGTEALPFFQAAQTALQAWQPEGDVVSSRTASALSKDIAYAYLLAGDLAQGREALDRAVQLAGSDPRALAYANNNYGFYHLVLARALDGVERRRELLLSVEKHRAARDHARQANDGQIHAIALNNLASIYQRLGDISNAHTTFLEALSLISDKDELSVQVYLLSNLGTIAMNMGDYDRSREYLERGIALTQFQAPNLALTLTCSLGVTERELGELELARELHHRCADDATQGQQWNEAASAWLELAVDYEADQAAYRHALSQSYSLVDGVTSKDVLARLLARQSLALQADGDSQRAADMMHKALTTAAKARHRETRVEVLDADRRLALLRGETQAAIAAGEKLLAEVEDIHLELNQGFLGASWSGRTHEYYVGHAETLIANASTDADWLQALNTFERSRAISLKTSAGRQFESGADLASLSKLSAIANDRAESDTDLGFDYYLQRDLVAYQSRLEALAQPDLGTQDWRSMQAGLQDDEAVIYPLLGSSESWLFVIRRDAFHVSSLGDSHDILNRARSARDGILQGVADTQSIQALSEALFPVAPLSGSKHLIVVPHRALHAFPFAALHSPGSDSNILNTHSVRIAPALSFIGEQPALTGEYTVEVAVIADPVFDTVVSDAVMQNVNLSSDETFRGWSEGLTPLPWTAREATDLRTRFGEANTLVYTGAQATRRSLVSESVRNARILHLATHGYFKASHPNNVGFALAGLNEAGMPEPGFVTLSELLSYRFNNELVVISGCDTAMGQSFAGEGMMGLSRGFLEQGAKNVISTLWPVSDRASARFMHLFYESLAEDAKIVDALRTAQLGLQAMPQYREPRHWAGYVLTSVDRE